jgi:hypothetical protein
MEDATSQGSTHDLLLALAGRVDDDLLRWARELVALGEDARAVEMVTASLVAARAVLPAPVRSAVVAAAHSARTDLGADTALPPPHPEDGTEHRFTTPDRDDPVAKALLDLPARPLTGCTVLLASRLTPAGTAPGPLPHPVVLVRMHTGPRPADVLAYQLGAALERVGATATVEVLPSDGPVPPYHAGALASAVELRGEAAADRPWHPDPMADEVTSVPAIPPHPAERHALAPPVEPPAPRVAQPEPSPPEIHPLARRDPEPPSEDLFSRHTLAPALRHPDPDPPAAEREPGDEAVTETGRLLSSGGREREGAAGATTAQLPTAQGHRLDDDHQDDYQDDYLDDEDDYADDERDDDRDDSDPGDDIRDDIRDDLRDDIPEHDEPPDDTFPEPLSPHPLAAPRPLPAWDESRPSRPIPLPASPAAQGQASGGRPRPVVTPISRPAVPNPIPLVRRTGPTSIPRPLPFTDPRPAVRPVDDDRDAPPADERAGRPGVDRQTHRPQDPRPLLGDTPAFDSLSDPLNGPLHQPLLAPLLDPSTPEDDPLGLTATARRPEPEHAQDDEWSSQWFSGAWAMAPSALEEGGDARPERAPEPDDDVEPGRPAPRPAPRSPARHRYYTDEPSNGAPVGAEDRTAGDDAADVDEPADRDAGERAPARPDLGLRPESIARLSDADRQLLARLQAELRDGRRRFGRRIINGSGATTNGSHRGQPPDLVG